MNTEFWSDEPKRLLHVDELHEMIMQTEDIDGVTFTGGEPFEQAYPLFLLAKKLKKSDISIVSYTGCTIEELRNQNDACIQGLLSTLDILIDGPYVKKLKSSLLWRGSSNQRIHILTDRYREYPRHADENIMDLELALDGDTLSMSGNFDEKMISKIKRLLSTKYGINIK